MLDVSLLLICMKLQCMAVDCMQISFSECKVAHLPGRDLCVWMPSRPDRLQTTGTLSCVSGVCGWAVEKVIMQDSLGESQKCVGSIGVCQPLGCTRLYA